MLSRVVWEAREEDYGKCGMKDRDTLISACLMEVSSGQSCWVLHRFYYQKKLNQQQGTKRKSYRYSHMKEIKISKFCSFIFVQEVTMKCISRFTFFLQKIQSPQLIPSVAALLEEVIINQTSD